MAARTNARPRQLPPLPAAGSEVTTFDRALALDELPTPALVVDVLALERNIARMAAHLKRHRVGCRPHTKTHKCPTIARLQLGAGAVGLCCARVGEAEVMAAAGCSPLLVTSPVVSVEATRRLAALALATKELAVVVDSELGARRLSQAALEAGVTIDVLVDLDPGTHRTGVALGAPAVLLARQVCDLPGLRLRGVQAYAGHLQHVHGFEQRRALVLETWTRVAETVELFRAAGLAHDIVTGGGTGSYDIDTEATVAIPGTGPGLTDVQVGSYVFMDREYRAIGARAAGGGDAAVFEPFETALYVLLTAISQPVSDRITVDGGFKAFATDSVEPELLDVAGVRYRFAGDEHGILDLREAERAIGLGERLRLRVPHCDPTVNLYDGMWAAHDDEIVAWWPIAARGRGF